MSRSYYFFGKVIFPFIFAVSIINPAAAQTAVPSLAQAENLSQNTTIHNPAEAVHTPQSLADLADNLLKSVVNISVSQSLSGTEESGDDNEISLRPGPFNDLFEEFFKGDAQSRLRKVESVGAGFVINAEQGLIATNNHVIDSADLIEVNFIDGDKLTASLVGTDPKTDLALLKVDPQQKQLVAVAFGDSDQARIGDWVMAIGNPYGYGGSVTLGIISALNRNIKVGPYDDYIQTDAAINRGNSGGPLFNMQGEVIGINTAIVSPTGGSIGLGFAVPSDIAVGVLSQLQQYGETRRGRLGIRVLAVDDDIADSFDLPDLQGAFVSGKIDNKPDDTLTDHSAIKIGDVIRQFNGHTIMRENDLPRLVAETLAGEQVDLVVWRDGREQKVRVTLGRLQESTAASDDNKDVSEQQSIEAQDEEEVIDVLGMRLATLNADLRERYGIDEEIETGAVVQDIDVNSIAEQKRISVGDVIVRINQEPVNSIAAVQKRLQQLRDLGRKNALLVIADRSGTLRLVTVSFD